MVVLYLSVLVLLPLAALTNQAFSGGLSNFWTQVTSPQALRSLELTVIASLIVVVINAFFGTILAWLLVRDEFPGKSMVNAVIDLPFALPTIVASLVLIELFGPKSPFGVDIALSQAAVVVALLFVTLPFVVRAVQPLLIEMDREMEEAAASLGAGGFTIFRRIIFPNLLPGLAAGVALAFARALGEYGSVLLFAGGLPGTMVSSVFISQQIESGNETGAAAVSVVLLLASLALLFVVSMIQRWGSRHERSSGGGLTTMPMSGQMPPSSGEDDDERV
jgi:sulfate transport system permease protein